MIASQDLPEPLDLNDTVAAAKGSPFNVTIPVVGTVVGPVGVLLQAMELIESHAVHARKVIGMVTEKQRRRIE